MMLMSSQIDTASKDESLAATRSVSLFSRMPPANAYPSQGLSSRIPMPKTLAHPYLRPLPTSICSFLTLMDTLAATMLSFGLGLPGEVASTDVINKTLNSHPWLLIPHLIQSLLKRMASSVLDPSFAIRLVSCNQVDHEDELLVALN